MKCGENADSPRQKHEGRRKAALWDRKCCFCLVCQTGDCPDRRRAGTPTLEDTAFFVQQKTGNFCRDFWWFRQNQLKHQFWSFSEKYLFDLKRWTSFEDDSRVLLTHLEHEFILRVVVASWILLWLDSITAPDLSNVRRTLLILALVCVLPAWSRRPPAWTACFSTSRRWWTSPRASSASWTSFSPETPDSWKTSVSSASSWPFTWWRVWVSAESWSQV